MGTEDGSVKIFWDITALNRDLQESNFPVTLCDTSDLCKSNHFNGNAEYAMTTDVSKPCILIELANRHMKLIDGNHRLYKASKLSIRQVPCYIVPSHYHIKYIVDYDAEEYAKLIKDAEMCI